MSEVSSSILVIDDERPIRRLLRVTLEGAGYLVREAENGRLGLVEAAQMPVDAVILDLGLPDLDGAEVVRRLREWSRVPVLILSVRDREEAKIGALDAGADDYLTKPFSSRELLARLRAVLRRSPSGTDPSILVFDDVEMDLAARIVRRSGSEVHLTTKEYALFKLLAQHRGKVVTHRQILRDLWGPSAEQNTHYLRVHMNHLRAKLEKDPAHPRLLRTESGIGYRLVPPGEEGAKAPDRTET
jgi:two-component system, OmpR family, KDP operon response regulator KdpE